MEKRPYFIVNTEVAIRNTDGQYLFIRRGSKEDHSPGTLSLPGGKLDQTAISPAALEANVGREILEEVGLHLGPVTYVESKAFLMDTGEWCLSVCFFCQEFTGNASCVSSEEVEAAIWLLPAELEQQTACPPWVRQSIQRAEAIR